MTTFTIDAQNQIVAFATAEEAAAATATPFDTFTCEQELAELAGGWPAERLLAIWNTLPGVTPAKHCKNRKTFLAQIWERIQSLAEASAPQAAPQAKVAPRAPKGRAKHKAAKTGKGKAAKSPAQAPRQGSKTAQVIAMLRRKNGATLSEIMDKMGWQKHTVRGFMAGAMKKAGHTVESFKPEGGERTYRLCGAPHNR